MRLALVTGARGFIGRYVLRELAGRGVRTVTLGRASSRFVASPQHVPLADVCDVALLRQVINRERPDVIFHLAGTAQAVDISNLYQANVAYACAILTAARSADPPPVVVLAGSATEYGPVPEDRMPVSEDWPARPTSPYGISKLAQTLHGLAAAAEGAPVLIARLFNPIGAGMPELLALGNFAAQIARMPASGGTLVTGDLDSIRDFMPVSEMARFLVELSQIPAAFGSVLNICSGRGTPLRQWTERLVARYGAPVQITFDPARVGTNSARLFVGDPSRLHGFGLSLREQDPDVLADEIIAASRSRGPISFDRT